MPNPGTQEQESGEHHFPAPYNVFEFVGHMRGLPRRHHRPAGGPLRQLGRHQHGIGARDPIFRANELIVNDAVKQLTGEDGAGNLCFRCHSSNGWYSGRFNPTLAGDAQGATMDHASSPRPMTRASCARCVIARSARHHGRSGGSELATDEPAFKMMASVNDTRMAGGPDGGDYPERTRVGEPIGDSSLQINDGMTYGGKYAGSVEVTFSDEPMSGTNYTGQTYGVYPDFWISDAIPKIGDVPFGAPVTNPSGQHIVYNPDGSVSPHFEYSIDVPTDGGGNRDYQAQAISLEHPTFKGDFIQLE